MPNIKIDCHICGQSIDRVEEDYIVGNNHLQCFLSQPS
jgi:hypothetical protein